MLPPISPNVLENNPKFKALYTNLAGSRLNADGSTRLIKQQRAQAELEKQLVTARRDAAQRTLLKDALRAVSLRMNDLPPELIETCHIISAQLEDALSPSDLDILTDDIDYFVSHIKPVASEVSKQLEDSALLLAKLALADVNISQDAQALSQLTTHASALQETIANQTASISLTRTRITELGDQIHAAYRDLFETSIRIIEQTIHGSISRGTKAKAEHLAVVAKGMELKLQILAQTDSILTDPALQSDLEEYKSRLENADADLSSRAAAAEKALSEYERAGKGMTEIAKRYADLMKACDGVRDEIQKLESRSSDVD
ncbi:uncharacterized protein PV09_02719 [Verruconis gallopava]|uniref:Uncharacterized protein n=1 Tax=Verruconis gallopava TaxID=253628 RepID=A0A0D1XTY9_9PEZI|nr:uncharacterized protein PV09_02719 [Verruconis gallopava]KIW06246.1 hypothetical protein PV09_02719 [Verruconis gallopava]